MNSNINYLSQLSESFFNQQWQLYQKVLKNNYMSHQEIYKCLSDFIGVNFEQKFSLLDLGCGDAEFITKILLDKPIDFYQGIDLSQEALNIATVNLQCLPCKYELNQENLFDFIIQNEQRLRQKFDIIFSSFSLHHLTKKDKEIVMTKIPKLLKNQGYFILVDVMRLPDENRDDYLQRYFTHIRQDWQLITEQEYQLITDHVSSSDFPETLPILSYFAEKAGFNAQQCLYEDTFLTNKLLCFQK